MMKRVEETSLFKGFKVNEATTYNMVQFADDTLFVGEGNWENLWCFKAFLRGFEMVSGLKVNFLKSSLCGINLKEEFLVVASTFLHCATSSIPFKFLGIMVGDSPLKAKLWNPVLEVFRKRFRVWRGKNLSIGGRVVLINSVLNALLIFTLSFYKAHVVVLKEIIKIQSRFLWGSSSNHKPIH
ncbi:unnamed protein product [Lathyrus sativus]|nr:unnamed protein product [Lathyrus sativus]